MPNNQYNINKDLGVWGSCPLESDVTELKMESVIRQYFGNWGWYKHDVNFVKRFADMMAKQLENDVELNNEINPNIVLSNCKAYFKAKQHHL